MRTLFAVLDDLLRFVFVDWFGFKNATGVQTLSLSTYNPAPLPSIHKAYFPGDTAEHNNDSLMAKTATVSTQPAPVYVSPVREFDGVIKRLPYGTTVKLTARKNNWTAILYKETPGWMMSEHLTTGTAYPIFKSGEQYDTNNAETKKLRAFISDEFAGHELSLLLSDVEYVAYRLLRKNRHINWGEERPRLSGRWQKLLRGKSGIHIGVLPVTDSVMETIDDEDIGHVAYVDAVFPNDTILVSEIGFKEEGVYTERTLTNEEWREYQPVFIAVS